MKKQILILLLLVVCTVPTMAQEDSIVVEKFDKIQLNYGGALRFNYNLSSWKPNQIKRGGDFGFEVFRINVDAKYKKWEFHIDQRFYAAGFGGAFLKYGYFQYNFNEKNHIKLGQIPAYFGTEQFNSHSWFFQLPFYLGFEDDHDMGVSYDFENDKIQFDLGFYKNAETLSFADNAPVSDARYSYDFSGRNKEVNQLNTRLNYKFGKTAKQSVGVSTQVGGIWNIDTKEIGRQAALSLHYELDYKNLNLKLQGIAYNNQPENAEGESRDRIEMTAYGFPYQTAAKANIYSISIAYSIPVKWGPITSLQIYDDYSYMDKSVESWEDTQMNVFGILVSANPIYVYLDYASGLHQPWLGPQWENALTEGDEENSWESRFNVNFGYYF